MSSRDPHENEALAMMLIVGLVVLVVVAIRLGGLP